ncbi:MAG: polynucleotide adenylyltransferase PcnB [Burkholderia sp.]|nr:polynucleotide adenylyltransferase PcnB [Burkholderia sp.]
MAYSCYEPTVISVNKHRIDPSLISRNAIRVTDILQRAGFYAFIVGGAVRDLLLGISPKDFDVATDATPTEIQCLFHHARVIGRRFQIIHVQFGKELIEVSTFRALVNAEHEVSLDNIYALKDTDNYVKRLKRSEIDRHAHAVDARGRVLRDNVWGKQHEDATRRDFTINAMYYDPATQTVLDYHDGMADIHANILRIIGDPVTRYREDPVRMLRVIRFAAKLNFDIETNTRTPIRLLSDLINSVPGARLFDEILKLLLSGHALACLNQLRREGLHHRLLPILDVVLEQPQGEKFIRLALNNADERVRNGKSVSPGFIFATLLWHDMRQRWEKYTASGEFLVPALHHAIDDVLDMQTKKLTIQRRYSADMREIWGLQIRLEKRSGRRALRILEHPRFRAGYDFLLLRCESGELETEAGEWWTGLIKADTTAREILLTQANNRNKKKKHTVFLTADDISANN